MRDKGGLPSRLAGSKVGLGWSTLLAGCPAGGAEEELVLGRASLDAMGGRTRSALILDQRWGFSGLGPKVVLKQQEIRSWVHGFFGIGSKCVLWQEEFHHPKNHKYVENGNVYSSKITWQQIMILWEENHSIYIHGDWTDTLKRDMEWSKLEAYVY